MRRVTFLSPRLEYRAATGRRGGADLLVILTACYFHDIVSLAKTILNVITLHGWRRETQSILQSAFPDFQPTVILLLCMPFEAR